MKFKVIISTLAFSGCLISATAQNTLPTTGNVGIGTTSPSEPLEVDGNTKINGDLLMNTSSFINLNKTKGTSYYNYGAVGINFKRTGTTDYKLYTSYYPGPGAGLIHLVHSNNNGIHLSGAGIHFGAAQTYDAQANYHFDNQVFTPSQRLGVKAGGSWSNSKLAIGSHDVPGISIRASQAAYGYASTIDCEGDVSIKAFAVRNHGGSFNNATKDQFIVLSDGSTRIGETDNGDVWPTGYKLAVNGKVICEEIKVELSNTWGDFVFDKNYDLMSLEETENFINENSHLPGIPKAEVLENDGLEMGEMLRNQMIKIEELTLHTIEQQKQLNEQAELIEKLISALNK